MCFNTWNGHRPVRVSVPLRCGPGKGCARGEWPLRLPQGPELSACSGTGRRPADTPVTTRGSGAGTPSWPRWGVPEPAPDGSAARRSSSGHLEAEFIVLLDLCNP